MKTKPCSKCGQPRVVGSRCGPCRAAYQAAHDLARKADPDQVAKKKTNRKNRYDKMQADPDAKEAWHRGIVEHRNRNLGAGKTTDGKDRQKPIRYRHDAVSDLVVAAKDAPKAERPKVARVPREPKPVVHRKQVQQESFEAWMAKPVREKCPTCLGIIRDGVCRVCER